MLAAALLRRRIETRACAFADSLRIAREENPMPFRRGNFALTPPSLLLFAISLVLAIVAILVYGRVINIPAIGAARAFYMLAIAYVVLAAGVLLRRL